MTKLITVLIGAAIYISFLIAGPPVLAQRSGTDQGVDSVRLFQALPVLDETTVKQLLAADPALVNSSNPQGQTPLHFMASLHPFRVSQVGPTPELALARYRDIVTAILACKPDVNALDGGARTPLYIARHTPNAWMVQQLQAMGAVDPLTDFFKAVVDSDTPSILKMIAANPKLVKAEDLNNRSVLIQSILWLDTDLARLLLAKGADPMQRDSGDLTALKAAIDTGQTELAKSLVARDTDLDPDTGNPDADEILMDAQDRQEAEVVALICAKARMKPLGWIPSDHLGAMKTRDLAAFPNDPFFAAVIDDDVKSAAAALTPAELSKTDAAGRSALHLCAELGYADMAEMLLAHGCAAGPEDKLGRTPLDYAAGRIPELYPMYRPYADHMSDEHFGDPKVFPDRSAVLAVLHKYHAGSGLPTFERVVDDGGIHMARVMIAENPALVKGFPAHGESALATAITSQNDVMIDLLLKNGAPLTGAQDGFGDTILFTAAANDNLDIAKRAIAAGVDVKAVALSSFTALHQAVMSDATDIARLLLDHGADVNAQDRDGRTPLMMDYKAPDDNGLGDLLRAHGARVIARVQFQVPVAQLLDPIKPPATPVDIWAGQSGDPPQYRVVDIAPIDGDTGIRACAVNDNGIVCGSSSGQAGTQAVIWSPTGQITVLKTPGRPEATVSAVNASGVAIGSNFEAPYIWGADHTGHAVSIKPIGSAELVGLDSAGDAVGTLRLGNVDMGIEVLADGTQINLGTIPGGVGCGAYAIDDAGDIAGVAGRDAVIWRGGKILDLNPPGHYSYATGINSKGHVVGYIGQEGGSYDGFVWVDGAMTILAKPSSAYASEASKINDAGLVVGKLRSMTDNDKAALWYGGKGYDLNALTVDSRGWQLDNAIDINNHGWILCTGMYRGSMAHAALLIPIDTSAAHPGG